MDLSFICFDQTSSRHELFEFIDDERIFPKSFPLNMDERIEICDYSLKAIEELLKTHKNNLELIDLIRRKLILYIYSNPYYCVSELYYNFYKTILQNPPNQPYISKYISPSHLPNLKEIAKNLANNEPLDCFMIPSQLKTEKILLFLIEIFNFNFGKIPNMEKILLWFPDYFVKFQTTYNNLMYGDGPLPLHIRFFIGIISAACYNSDYLINRLAMHFIKTGGDPEWLQKGISAAPERIQKLSEVILLTAYTPWKLMKFHFFQNNEKGANYWSKNELIQVFMIVGIHHSLACFCIANGILHEVDSCLLSKTCDVDVPTFYTFEAKKAEKKRAENVLEALKEIVQKENDNNSFIEEEKIYKNMIEKSFKKRDNHNSDNESPQTQKKKNNKKLLNKSEEGKLNVEEISYNNNSKKYLIKSNEVFLDNFEWHKYKGLKSFEKNWDNDTFYYINELFPILAQNLNDKFKYTRSMTNQIFIGETVNTEPFRKGIWNYTENVYGYTYSDYDYKNINKLIPRTFKSFIKNVVSNPGLIKLSTFNDIPFDFRPFEYTQASLLAIEAKYEISLIYSMTALEALF